MNHPTYQATGMRPRTLPKAVMDELFDHLNQTMGTSFPLTPSTQAAPTTPPFDLDAMCEQARAAVLATVCAAAKKHQAEMKAYWAGYDALQKILAADLELWTSFLPIGRFHLQLKGMA